LPANPSNFISPQNPTRAAPFLQAQTLTAALPQEGIHDAPVRRDAFYTVRRQP